MKKRTKHKIEDMTVFELAGWFALLNAIDLIDVECIKRGIKPKNFNISQMQIMKSGYIEDMRDFHVKKITNSINVVDIHTKIIDFSTDEQHKIIHT